MVGKHHLKAVSFFLIFLLTPQFVYNKSKSVNTYIIFISGTAFLSDSKIKSLADVFVKFWLFFLLNNNLYEKELKSETNQN